MTTADIREWRLSDYDLTRGPRELVRWLEREPMLSPAGQKLFGISILRDARDFSTVIRCNVGVMEHLLERSTEALR